MCRAGGRRCSGGNHSSKAAQNHRQRTSRARKALRNAKASGDPAAIEAAQQRLAQLKTPDKERHPVAHETTPQPGKPHESAPQDRDVTPPAARVDFHNTNYAAPGANVGQQTDVNNEPFTMNVHSSDATWKAAENNDDDPSAVQDNDRGQRGDVTAEPPAGHENTQAGASGGMTITNIATGGSIVGIQAGIIFGDTRVNGRRVSTDTAVQHGDVTNSSATEPQQDNDSTDHSGQRVVYGITNVAYDNVGIQAGIVNGGVYVNGQRVDRPTQGAGTGPSPDEVHRIREDAHRVAANARQQAARMREQAHRAQESQGQDGDVTVTRSTFRTSDGGTVTNIVHGKNTGTQAGDINGPLHFGPGGFTIGDSSDDR